MGCGSSSGSKVSNRQLERAGLHFEDWMYIVNRGGVQEKDMIRCLSWFNSKFKGGVTSDQFRAFFPAMGTGKHIANIVFRVLDRDSSGTIGFMELMLTLELVGAVKFQEEVGWAFKLFDVDNSGEILVSEIFDSVKAVWVILEGMGDSIDGSVDEITTFLHTRLMEQGQQEVSEPEFVRFCVLDPGLGDCVVRIFRAVINTWSFLFERWSSGMFFTQTKPPQGPFWDKLADTTFQTAEFHSPAREETEEERVRREAKEADELARSKAGKSHRTVTVAGETRVVNKMWD